jgi:transglutaminase-like putative cysteine protease
MQKVSAFLLSIFFVGAACQVQAQKTHFITDPAYRQQVEKDFDAKMDLMGKKFYAAKSLHPTLQEQEALEFLYAYMPMADLTDYPTAYYLNNVRAAFRTRAEMPWGKTVPELLFRHFVLPIRVNNENLDGSRTVFYRELKPRIEHLNMKDAILEVNHWCHEKVTYQPSDARTTSPLASVCSAYGRCGEESTFTVAALRSVGIPARQVYTPRWAHTDDNHAWVEAWADGQWYFFGACEPEAVLNLGWFNAPASRALLMHTRVFGNYNGPEEVMLRTPNTTEINLIDNYAQTARADFLVLGADGSPVPDARVDFKIYNYAEFYTAVTKYTDDKGETFLTAGQGDMLAWASKNGQYGFAKVSFGKDKKVIIRLTRSHESDVQQTAFDLDSINIVPPAAHVQMPPVSDLQRKANDLRKSHEDSLRTAYMRTFLTPERAASLARSMGLPPDSVAPFLVASRGNHRNIAAFLKAHSKDGTGRMTALLRSLSDKDLRDISTAVLDDSYRATASIVCPRVENEMLYPYKEFFLHVIPSEEAGQFRQDPATLVRWCKENLRVEPSQHFDTYAMSSVGVWNARVCNTRSRDIFFVDVARSLGIDARKDPVTQKTQYRTEGNAWVDVDFDAQAQTSAPTGTLLLTFQPNAGMDDAKYYSHFTISQIRNGVTSLLSFDEGQVDMGGGVSWSNTFKKGVKLDEGTYILVTGTRLANGSVLATTRIFNISAGQTTTLPLCLRAATGEVSVIGDFDSESKYTAPTAGNRQSILSQTGRGYFVVGIMGVGQEPTNHALRDLAAQRQELEKWGRPLLLLFTDSLQMHKFQAADYGQLPKTVIYGIDADGSIQRQIATNMKVQNPTLLPLFIIADTFNRVVFFSQGYTIGLGEQLLRTINKL